VKKNNFLVGFSFLILPGFTSALTLKEAYDAALKKTESVAIAESQLRAADSKVDQNRANFLPDISLKGDYNVQNQNIGTSTEKDQTSSRINLSQSLLAGGKDRANYKASTAARTSQEYNVEATRDQLYSDVSKAFYALMAARADAENIEKTIELLNKRIVELEKLNRVGRSRPLDVLAAKAQIAVLESQKVAAIAARRIAKNNFADVTGLERDSELLEGSQLPDSAGELQNYLRDLEKRPDIQSLKALNSSYEYSVDAASAGHLPSLDLSGNYFLSHDGAPTTTQNRDDWNATVTLTIPVFSGGEVNATVRQANELKTQSDLTMQKRLRDAEADVRTAYNNLVSALEQIKALETALSITEQNYRQQEKDYGYRLASNLDVLQALTSFQDTKRSLDKTRFQAYDAIAQLKAKTNTVNQ
jgi:outer membrane protein